MSKRLSKTDLLHPYERQGKRASALGVRLASLARTGPMALIQFIDFVTDILVIAELYSGRNARWPIIATGFVCLSVAFSIFQVLIQIKTALHKERAIAVRKGETPERVLDYISNRDFTMTAALAPVNLHLFYWATLIGKAEQAGDNKTAHTIYFHYTLLKIIETACESIPMLCITLWALFEERD